jgi:hypothetical protein
MRTVFCFENIDVSYYVKRSNITSKDEEVEYEERVKRAKFIYDEQEPFSNLRICFKNELIILEKAI